VFVDLEPTVIDETRCQSLSGASAARISLTFLVVL